MTAESGPPAPFGGAPRQAGRLRARLRRAGLVRLRVALYLGRRLGPALAAMAGYTALAGALVRWDGARHGAALPDWGATMYAIYTQLFFEPTDPLPSTTLARIVFWVTPVLGALLVAEGIVKVGSEVLEEDRRHALWVRIMTETFKDHVVVCGLGHVGYRVVEELRALGEDVVGIEREGSEFVAILRDAGVPVHVGDARRDDLLLHTGIARAKAVVCATNDDLANLEIALDAKRMNPAIRVIMRMFDQRLAAKVGGALELDQSFSTSALSALVIALSARLAGVKSAYRLGEGARVVCELEVPRAWAGRTVAALEADADLRVVRLGREGGYERARQDHVLRAGEAVVVDADAEELSRAPR
ncbi:MAG TPA: NAD-binding protein [Polyangiaceae bacterium]|jgi:Trk K+ transport system NAD-binding subunit|nr:NAD-binding protein [Polyangiaceae bacterium]